MTDVTRPTLTNDSGTFTSGTVIDADLFNDVLDQIDDQCSSATNAQKPKATTDEVITARGSKVSLDARLDVSLNNDGTLIDDGTFATPTDLASVIAPGNWIQNDDFRVWCAGDAAAPTGWTLVGAGASVARDTAQTPTVGTMDAALTRAGTDCYLSQVALATMANALFLRGKYVSIGCYVKVSAGSRAYISVSDGITTTTSSAHTGSGNWEWIATNMLISASGTGITVKCEVKNGNTTAYFNGFSAVIFASAIALPHYIPCPTVERQYTVLVPGGCAVGLKAQIIPFRTGVIRDVQLSLGVSASVGTLTCDVNTWTGAAYVSAFSTRPTVVAGSSVGGTQPDSATYATKCLRGSSGGSLVAGGAFTLDVDIDDGGTAADLVFNVRATEYSRPQERFLAYSEF